MPIMIAPVTAQAEPYARPCDARRLELSVQSRADVADYAPRSGFLLSIRNHGPDCALAALPIVTLEDVRGRALPASRRPPVGMHPGPVMVPVFIGGGHRATIELGWAPCAGRCSRVRRVVVRFEDYALSASAGSRIPPLPAGRTAFDQAPVHAEEGMAEG